MGLLCIRLRFKVWGLIEASPHSNQVHLLSTYRPTEECSQAFPETRSNYHLHQGHVPGLESSRELTLAVEHGERQESSPVREDEAKAFADVFEAPDVDRHLDFLPAYSVQLAIVQDHSFGDRVLSTVVRDIDVSDPQLFWGWHVLTKARVGRDGLSQESAAVRQSSSIVFGHLEHEQERVAKRDMIRFRF